MDFKILCRKLKMNELLDLRQKIANLRNDFPILFLSIIFVKKLSLTVDVEPH